MIKRIQPKPFNLMFMKKSVLILIIIITTDLCSNAQPGLRFGLNVTNDKFNYDASTTIIHFIKKHIGLLYEYKLNEYLFIRPEILYSEKGIEIDFKDTLSKYKDMSYSPKCIEIPILLEVKKKINEKGLKFFGIIGPYFGIGIGGKYEFNERIPGETNWLIFKNGNLRYGRDMNKDHYKRIDIGIFYGLGIEYKIIQFSISNAFGLKNISPNNNIKHFSRTLEISVGYRYNFSSKRNS